MAASATAGTPPGFEIWQSARGVHSETNAIRMAMLAALEKGPKTLNDLVKATKRSKPTLSSLHVPALQAAGLVVEAADPKDARVKWYRLTGTRIGSSALDPATLRAAVLGFVQQRGMVPLAPLLEVVDPRSLAASADTDYVASVGARLGTLVGRMLTATSPRERLQELSVILAKHQLGELSGTPTAPRSTAPKALQGFVLALARSAVAPPAPSGSQ